MSKYLERYAYYKKPLITELPSDNLYLSIVIPCFNEPNITTTLNSLLKCIAPKRDVEVIIVINNSEKASKEIINQNKNTVSEIINFKTENPKLTIQILQEMNLPKKHAGVGLARKIGMDEAVIRNPDGIIVCLDADSLVEENYLIEIENHFSTTNLKNPPKGCSIHFEHPILGNFEEDIYNGIIAYELHLRYFINAQRFAGHPHAYQTIGSSMAVRSDIYEKVVGMPKKQAGEDFYFLQKVIQLGGFSELKTTKVIPSPRVSDRVPFGTGKAVGEYLDSNKESDTYSFKIFVDLKNVIIQTDNIFNLRFDDLPVSMLKFWETTKGFDEVEKIKTRSKTLEIFRKHFFNWFNAFQVMKYVHFCRDNYYPNQNLAHQCDLLLKNKTPSTSLKELLKTFRELDLSNSYKIKI